MTPDELKVMFATSGHIDCYGWCRMCEVLANWFLPMVAERDAALAECERLRHELRRPEIADENNVVMTGMWEAAIADRDAWRACAARLAAQVRRQVPHGNTADLEALAVYETLSRGVRAPEAGETTL
jgi:hypothetical protein